MSDIRWQGGEPVVAAVRDDPLVRPPGLRPHHLLARESQVCSQDQNVTDVWPQRGQAAWQGDSPGFRLQHPGSPEVPQHTFTCLGLAYLYLSYILTWHTCTYWPGIPVHLDLAYLHLTRPGIPAHVIHLILTYMFLYVLHICRKYNCLKPTLAWCTKSLKDL